MRRIGQMLIRERRPDLWREAYQAFLASLWPDHDYKHGDETRFLRGSGSVPRNSGPLDPCTRSAGDTAGALYV